MAQTITGITQTKVLNQLDTYNHTALATSMYTVDVHATEIPASGLIITIKQNGSTIVTSAVPAAAQNHSDLRVVLNCAATDIIGVQLSSGVTADTGKNVVKAILNIHQGST